ncbi:EexN family lipoprotein [Leptotrichia hongkongensis]|uniref:EexN family lipoprotein n=1 Tax=Leptotrichia hongkongensis TaxID=554406 RepID=UPI0035A865BE
MKKIRILYLIATSIVIFTSCGNKYSVENLKKNNNLLKETVQKCKIKRDEKICKNVEKAQSELALEAWNKVKPEIEAKLDKMSKELLAGNFTTSMENAPERLWEWEAKNASTTPQKAKEITLQLLMNALKYIKIEKVEYDFENVKIGQTNTGRNYVIIPTKSIVSGQGKKVELNQKSLVFEDKNKWYIVNINERNKHILKELYSDFKDVNID